MWWVHRVDTALGPRFGTTKHGSPLQFANVLLACQELTKRVIEDDFQSLAEWSGESFQPTSVDQSDFDHVAKMDLIITINQLPIRFSTASKVGLMAAALDLSPCSSFGHSSISTRWTAPARPTMVGTDMATSRMP